MSHLFIKKNFNGSSGWILDGTTYDSGRYVYSPGGSSVETVLVETPTGTQIDKYLIGVTSFEASFKPTSGGSGQEDHPSAFGYGIYNESKPANNQLTFTPFVQLYGKTDIELNENNLCLTLSIILNYSLTT
ncbi:MAG: hypothetical protein CMM87_06205 [Rickettsiales bacterium]|nr:hypothetical protein [Rickettsiales bacterium]|tara:strand:- start:8607 stop:8999 length:393 start_codon:yes stop_codon:yes gene_type:complete